MQETYRMTFHFENDYLDTAWDSERIEKLIDENVLALNAELAAYSKIGYTEIRRDAFEKTPKQSIRRFMYS